MDITTVFGTVVGGSNPSGCTIRHGTLVLSIKAFYTRVLLKMWITMLVMFIKDIIIFYFLISFSLKYVEIKGYFNKRHEIYLISFT